MLSLTHTFSPTLTNEFIFGPSSNFIELKPEGDKALASSNNINVPKLFPKVGAGFVPNFRFGGIVNNTFPFTNYNGLPFINQNHTFNFIDNVSKIVGSHTIKAGIYAQRSRKDQTAFARTDGDINFDNNGNNPLTRQHPFQRAAGHLQQLHAGRRFPQRALPLLERRGLHSGQLEGDAPADTRLRAAHFMVRAAIRPAVADGRV